MGADPGDAAAGFLGTETGGAAVLLAAAVAALVWVNVHASSYESLWGPTLSIDLGAPASRRIFATG